MSPYKNYIFTFPYRKDFYSYVDKGLKPLVNSVKKLQPPKAVLSTHESVPLNG